MVPSLCASQASTLPIKLYFSSLLKPVFLKKGNKTKLKKKERERRKRRRRKRRKKRKEKKKKKKSKKRAQGHSSVVLA